MYCTVLHRTFTVLQSTTLYPILSGSLVYCTVLWCTVLWCTVMYCTVLYCIVPLLYYNVQHCTSRSTQTGTSAPVPCAVIMICIKRKQTVWSLRSGTVLGRIPDMVMRLHTRLSANTGTHWKLMRRLTGSVSGSSQVIWNEQLLSPGSTGAKMSSSWTEENGARSPQET